MPNLRRPFDVVLFPAIPILGMVSCWFFVPTLEPQSLTLGAGLTVLGSVVYLARPENRLEVGTIPAQIERLRLQILLYWRPKMHVLIIGGGKQGRNIADRLLAQDEYRMIFRSAQYQITFVEEDEKRCEELETLYNAPVFQGDGTRQDILEQVGPRDVHVAIAASDNDERNAIAALQAKRLGVGRVIAIVRDPNHMGLLQDSGVETISQAYATAAMVENYLDRPSLAELFEIESGIASLLELVVPEDSGVVGLPIREILIPENCVIAAVIREEEFVVPRGGTVLQGDDRVVLVGPGEAVRAAHEIFTGERGAG
jgi:Trk K+ transport system NAD-binding subunit